jgi:hypothetical protein
LALIVFMNNCLLEESNFESAHTTQWTPLFQADNGIILADRSNTEIPKPRVCGQL